MSGIHGGLPGMPRVPYALTARLRGDIRRISREELERLAESLIEATTTAVQAAQSAVQAANDVQVGLAAKAPLIHTHPVGQLEADGMRDSTVYLRGDGVWATPPGDGGGGETLPIIGFDEDGVPYFDLSGVTGGSTLALDEDGVPYVVTGD